jgi:ferredoxin--NADP+ reductase
MQLGTEERPLRVAIVGSGPSGFYAADALLKSDYMVHVDMLEKLPVPFGLVRFGVAPDHAKIKNVTRIYEKIAAHESFSFFGNVALGQDLSMDELRTYYDAIIIATGAQTDKKLLISGINLKGSFPATDFVAWYNGHPEFQDLIFDLSGSSAVIIGHGNVALDVARILAKTSAELKMTDITEKALDILKKSKIKEIHLLGRRGPIQATFSDHELKEFGLLENCDVIVKASNLELSQEDQEEHDRADNKRARNNYLALKALAEHGDTGTKNKKLYIHFYQSPVELLGDGHVQSLKIEYNTLEGPAGERKVKRTGEMIDLPCDFFVRSIGYYGVPLADLPFDENRGVLPHEQGRVHGEEHTFVVGWMKRGPSGVIGTNKADSIETVRTLLGDLESLHPCENPDTKACLNLLKERKVRVISYQDWKRIDVEEIRRGEASGKSREKFTSLEDILSFLGD